MMHYRLRLFFQLPGGNRLKKMEDWGLASLGAPVSTRRILIASLSLGVGASLLLFVLGFQGVGFGIWYQSELPVAVMHGISGVCGLILAVWGMLDSRIRKHLIHPFVIIPLALALWSALSGLFHDHPWVGVFGSPEIGEGGLWFADLAILTASTMVLARFHSARLVLALMSMAVTAVLAGLTWAYFNISPRVPVPYFFPDYLAFVGGFSAMVAYCFFPRSRVWRFVTWSAVLVSVAAIIVSENWAARLLLFAAVPFLWVAAWKIPVELRQKRFLGAILIAGVPILTTATLMLPGIEVWAEQTDSLGKLANSMLSRYRLLNILVSSIAEDPSLLLVGRGWGMFSDLLAIHLPVEWAILHEGLTPMTSGIEAKSWDAVLRVDFHSHNFLAEAMVGGGIPAAILACSIFFVLPLYSWRRLLPLSIAFGTYSAALAAYWFQMPLCLPFMAVAWGAMGSPMKKTGPEPRFGIGALVGSVIVGGLLLYQGIASGIFAKYAYGFPPPMTTPLFVKEKMSPCPWTFEDSGRGGFHLLQRVRTLGQTVANDFENGQVPSTPKLAMLRGAICTSEEYIEKGGAFRLLVSSLFARSDLAFVPSSGETAHLVSGYLANWGKRLDQALKIAPKRTDLAISYLLWLLRENREQEFSQLALRLHEMNPEDPVGLWFSGIALLGDPRQARAGLLRMRRGLEEGIERMVPVDDALKAQVMGQTGPDQVR